VDDVVVKTQEDEGLISDLAETFDDLRKFKMKLNPDKCTFGVPSGKLVRYMVSRHAITKMMLPESLYDVPRKESWNIGLSISTGPYNFRV
jgi:hypothetical protein